MMGKIIEWSSGIIISIFAFYLVGNYNIHIIGENGNLLNLYATVSGTIFGFLLASLAILLQTGTEPLSYLRENRKELFKRIIILNRKVVFTSVGVLFYSFCLLVYMSSNGYKTLCIIHSQIMSFLLIMMFFYMLYFLIVFYFAIHKHPK